MFGFGNDIEMSDENQAKLVAIFKSLRNRGSHEDAQEIRKRLQDLKDASLKLAWERFTSTHH